MLVRQIANFANHIKATNLKSDLGVQLIEGLVIAILREVCWGNAGQALPNISIGQTRPERICFIKHGEIGLLIRHLVELFDLRTIGQRRLACNKGGIRRHPKVLKGGG